LTREQYLAAVETRLGDLPWSVRKNLANELRMHLDEIPAQEEDLVATLGSPQSYAAELRAAADLRPRRGVVAFLRARRPRNLIFVVCVLAVAAAGIAALAWASSYTPPLEPGDYYRLPDESSTGGLGETEVRFREGKPFQYGFSMVNGGRFPVRIVGVPIMQSPFRMFVVRVFVEDVPTPNRLPADVPFHPFTLEPGSERTIVLRGKFARCKTLQPGSGVEFHTMPVRVRFLRWTHDTAVPLRNPLVISVGLHQKPCG
jgi:HAAS domain-containing protein